MRGKTIGTSGMGVRELFARGSRASGHISKGLPGCNNVISLLLVLFTVLGSGVHDRTDVSQRSVVRYWIPWYVRGSADVWECTGGLSVGSFWLKTGVRTFTGDVVVACGSLNNGVRGAIDELGVANVRAETAVRDGIGVLGWLSMNDLSIVVLRIEAE